MFNLIKKDRCCMALSKDELIVLNYLHDKIKEGRTFFKSKHIGKDIGFSSYSIGTILNNMRTKEIPLIISNYSKSNHSVTWMIIKKRSGT